MALDETKGIGQIVTPLINPVAFITAPDGDLIAGGMDLAHLVRRAVESEGANRANKRMADDIEQNRQWDKVADDKLVLKKQFEEKVYKGRELRQLAG